jgi:uncharacterized protein YabN with tetrapyrrole methylase and pyrophosphatase domain
MVLSKNGYLKMFLICANKGSFTLFNKKNMSSTANTAFERLVTIMNNLREKCPWDKKQTIETLRQLTIEETYELTDAITDGNWKGIKEE